MKIAPVEGQETLLQDSNWDEIVPTIYYLIQGLGKNSTLISKKNKGKMITI